MTAVPLRERVYRLLRDDLLNARISPRERLTEPKLSRRFQVSRTPVREAVSRLVADGLLERTDFGYAVVVPSAAELRDLDEVRLTLELRGLARCAELPGVVHDKDLLSAESARSPSGPDFAVRDEEFHRVLLRSAGNPQLTAHWETVVRRLRVARAETFLEPGRVERAVTEHAQLVELVLSGDLVAAQDVLRRH